MTGALLAMRGSGPARLSFVAMKDPRCEMLSTVLRDVLPGLRLDPTSDQSWASVNAAYVASREEDDVELFVAIDERDFAALSTIVGEWTTGGRMLVRHDREVLKRALKAFRKRLKIVRLDSESSVGVGPMSSGKQSSIVGVRPPDIYPQDVWDELVRQKRLVEGRDGSYELPDE